MAPLAEQTDRDNLFPAQLWEKFGEMGLLGITAPEEFGGLGKSYLDHVVAMEEVRCWSRCFSPGALADPRCSCRSRGAQDPLLCRMELTRTCV